MLEEERRILKALESYVDTQFALALRAILVTEREADCADLLQVAH